jgi:hypothetical protein
MIRLRVIVGLIVGGMVTVVALVWMGQLVGASHSACQVYPYTSGCR